MTIEEGKKMPYPLLKSVTMLFWHTGRALDLQISDLKRKKPMYTSNGWVDDNWTSSVTHQSRLVSIINVAIMHSGQVVYTRHLVINK